MIKMKFGLGTYALAWSIGVPGNLPEKPMDLYEFLDVAHRYDFNLVQIGDNLPLHHFSAKEIAKLKKYANSKGVSLEVGTRGLMPDNIYRHLEIAEILDSPILRVVIDQKGFEPELSEIHDIVRNLIPELEKRNISLAIENHDRFKASEFLKIIQQANSPFVGICLDPVNSIGADEGFETVFKTLAPHTINFHLKDYTIQRKPHMMGFEISGAPAGQGWLDLDQIISTLIKYGKCRSLILELWPEAEDKIELTIKKEQEWVRQSAQYLFEKFKQHIS
jgi:3-oxoisoapionate decarboxylase